jgi:endonuclease/exonuclease/phosphatase family metal-dependent hydrolase
MKTPKPQTLLALLLALALLVILYLLLHPAPGLRITTLRPLDIPGAAPLPDPSASPARPADAPIRIATYNIENFTDARRDGPLRTPALAAAQAQGAASVIAEADPDILVLQEIENTRALRELNAQLPEPFPWAYVTHLPASHGAAEKLNLALLSRIRPDRVRQLAFTRLDLAGRPSRGTLCAEFRTGDGARLLVYSIHLKSNFGEPPVNQTKRAIALHLIAADALSEALQNQPDATATLILGDTNVDPETPEFADDPSLRPLAGDYLDLWLGTPMPDRTTIPTRQPGDPAFVFPPSAFDRIFATRDLGDAGTHPWRATTPRSIQRGTATHDNTTQPGHDGHVSDHYLAYTDLLPRRTAAKDE